MTKTTAHLLASLLSLAACGPPVDTGGGGGAGGSGGAACACDCEPTAPSTHPIAYCEDPAHDALPCCRDDGAIGECSQGACTIAIPWDGSPYLGVGYDGSPCSAQGAYYLSPDETPALLSLAIVVPVNGFITGATVVHVVHLATVRDAADVCPLECDAPSSSVTYLCADVDAWKGCAPRLMTAVAWLNFAPE